MLFRPLFLLLFVMAPGCVQAQTSDRCADIRAALEGGSRYAARVLLDSAGRARGDYDWLGGTWQEYEAMWHTGQLINGLLAAYEVTADAEALAAARRGGDWWVAQEITDVPALRGMVRAVHGASVGALINATTVTDGTPGLFRLSRATGDPRYAQTAIRAGEWMHQHLYIEKEGLLYNIVDPQTGEIWKDRSPHPQHQGGKAKITEVARPNVEGYLYKEMYDVTQKKQYRQVFLRQCETLLARQSPNGFWMEFEPNDPKSGKIHPRFNTWNAEALVVAYDLTQDRRYLEAARRTARALVGLQQKDGTIYYDNNVDGVPRQKSVSGSAVAFAGCLWLQLRQRGAGDEFAEPLARALGWVLAHRFADDHPDPNLAGGFYETYVNRRAHTHATPHVRDIATAFSLRFLAEYHQQFCE